MTANIYLLLELIAFCYIGWNLNNLFLGKRKKYQLDHAVAFHTVDIAITRIRDGILEVLLIQKPSEVSTEFWRFPGGFVDPSKDKSAEGASRREGIEETKLELGMTAKYIGSSLIDDPRYKKSDHKIITSFYNVEYIFGAAGKGYDDVAKTQWFDANNIPGKNRNPIHTPLFSLLEKYLKENSKAEQLTNNK